MKIWMRFSCFNNKLKKLSLKNKVLNFRDVSLIGDYDFDTFIKYFNY